MGDRSRDLGEEQALFGNQPRQPALAAVTRQGSKVAGPVVAEEREMKSILAVGLAVASPRVAAQPGENRHDIFGEIPRASRTRLERDPRRGRLTFQGRLDRDDALPHRPEITARLELDQPVGFNCPLHL